MWQSLHQYVLSITTQPALTLGVPRVMVEYFLLLPFVVVIVAFLRHVVGLKTIGLFFPITLAVIFGLTGFTYGLALIMAVAILTFGGRIIARPFRLLYLPRSAFVISLVSLGVFWVILFLAAVMPRGSVESIPVLSFVVLLLFTEDFLRVLGERGARTGTILMAETVLIAIIGGLLLRWDWARQAIYNYPELLAFAPLMALLLNQWNGLRVAELYRFRKIRRKLVTANRR